MRLTIEEIRDFHTFVQLRDEWDLLAREAGQTSFFKSHSWFRCCWPQDARKQAFVLLVRQGGTLVGAIPLLTSRKRWRQLPVRVLSVLHNQDSPFVDPLLHPGSAAETWSAVLDHLHRQSGWDLLCLPKLPASSLLKLSLNLSSRRCWRSSSTFVHSPALRFDGTWTSFWTGQSQRFKKTVRSVSNRLERLGKPVIELLDETSPIRDCIEVFRRVAATSWKESLSVSITRDAEIARFFENLTETLHDRKQLCLWVLRLDGRPIATEYHVRDGDTVHALRSDFDDAFRPVSPGAYLNQCIIRRYFDSDVALYDMGPGDRAYKQRWATENLPLQTMWLFNRTAYGGALHGMEQLAIPLRRMRALLVLRGKETAQNSERL